MNMFDFAKKLNGRQYLQEITREEEMKAKELGFVVVFGQSDDNMEFSGAISDEVSCYAGRTVHLDKQGILKKCECNCRYYKEAFANSKTIKAVWGREGFSWIYDTDIKHATFVIYEEETPYCRGIVFEFNELCK